MDKIIKYKWRALYFLLAIASLAIYFRLQAAFRVSKRVTLNVWNYLGLGMLAVIVVAMIWLIYLWELKRGNEWQISKSPQWNKKSIIAIVVGFVVLFIFQLTIILMTSNKSHHQAHINHIISKSQWIFLIIVDLIGPIIEELIYRGMFFEIFFTKATKVNAVLGIFINGLLFAYMHTHNLYFSWSFLIYASMGWVFASTYLYSKNIYTDMSTHVLINLVPLIAKLLR